MPPIRWSSLIATPAGEIDFALVRQSVSILLGLVAGLVLVPVAVLIVAGRLSGASDVLVWTAGILITPITVGKAIDGWRAGTNRTQVQAIIRGDAPGRRASDPDAAAAPADPPVTP